MALVMPTAPALPAPAPGRATVRSGTGDAFAATLAAAAGETPAARTRDRDAAGPVDDHGARPAPDGDRAPTPTFRAVGAGPHGGSPTGTSTEAAGTTDAAATADGVPAPTGDVPTGGDAVLAGLHPLPATVSVEGAAGMPVGLAQGQPGAAVGPSEDAAAGPGQSEPSAAVASSEGAAGGVGRPGSPAGAESGEGATAGVPAAQPAAAVPATPSSTPAAAPPDAAPTAAPSTAAGVTSGAPAAEPSPDAVATPPAENATPARPSTGAPAGTPVGAAVAAGAGETPGLPDPTLPAGERPVPQAGPAGETAVRADFPPVRTESAGRVEQAAPAPSTPPAPPPVAPQLSTALARLRTAPEGTHVLHVRVDPEDLGPVRVTAHIGTDGVRIELFGVTDAARDALRGALSELRRDLAATGLRADLDLSADDGPHERPERAAAERRAESRPQAAAPTPPTPAAPVHPGRLDLLA